MIFSNSFHLYHGASWYPEQWDQATIREDVRQMVDLGLNAVRLGEFAWSSMEPKEGQLQFEWLIRALDLVGENGISAVLGTPSATPPQWLLLKHPEIGYVDDTGYRHNHGGRQHACYNNKIFRSHANRIAAAMAKAVGDHSAVVAWQIDNELRGHQKLCLCDTCKTLWGEWLQKRYGSLEELNRQWGTEVWSNTYDRFSEVPMPYKVPTWSHHYSMLLNYRRFMSDTVIEFKDEQVAELRKITKAPITHNTENSVAEFGLFRDLDFASADIYMDYLGPAAAQWRIDSMRNVKAGQRFWTMETGVDSSFEGHPFGVNWLPCFAFLNYTGGSQAFLYWPWRQNRGGTEIDHTSVIYASGKPSPGWEGAKKVSALRQKLEPILKEYTPKPAPTAFIRSETNGHYFFTDRVAGLEPNFDYNAGMIKQFKTLVDLGAWRDVLFDEAPLDNRKIIFSPHMPYAAPEFLEKIRLHLNRGGAWVAGPYCGYRDRDHTVPIKALFGDVEKLGGFETRFFVPGGAAINVSLANGCETKSLMYHAVFAPAKDDEVLGHYGSGRFAGQAWGLTRPCHGGRIYVLGSELEEEGRKKLFETILDREKIERHPMPAQVWFCPQINPEGKEAWALSNWGDRPQMIPLPRPGTDLLTGAGHEREILLSPFTSAFLAFK